LTCPPAHGHNRKSVFVPGNRDPAGRREMTVQRSVGTVLMATLLWLGLTVPLPAGAQESPPLSVTPLNGDSVPSRRVRRIESSYEAEVEHSHCAARFIAARHERALCFHVRRRAPDKALLAHSSLNFLSTSKRLIACFSASASPGAMNIPPPASSWGNGDSIVAMTAVPQAAASIAGRPNPSDSDGRTSATAPLIRALKSSSATNPSHRTHSEVPARAID